jgi:hypothetical protein
MGLIQRYVGFEDSPDLAFKVNAIVDFWSNPCDAPWTIYIETLYPAAGRFFLAIIDTSLLDIAREYLRPRQGLTRGNNRKKGRRRGRIGIPRVDGQMIGKLIPGASIWAANEYGANTKFLWQIDGIIQRGLWYVVLLDATAEGFYWWAQGIKEIGFCKPINRPGIFADNNAPLATAFFGQWYPSPGWNVHWKEGGFDWLITTLSTPSTWVAFNYNAFYDNTGSAWGRVEVRLKGAGADLFGSVIVPPHSSRQLNMSGTFRGGATFQLEQRCLGTPWIKGRQGTWWARKVE